MKCAWEHFWALRPTGRWWPSATLANIFTTQPGWLHPKHQLGIGPGLLQPHTKPGNGLEVFLAGLEQIHTRGWSNNFCAWANTSHALGWCWSSLNWPGEAQPSRVMFKGCQQPGIPLPGTSISMCGQIWLQYTCHSYSNGIQILPSLKWICLDRSPGKRGYADTYVSQGISQGLETWWKLHVRSVAVQWFWGTNHLRFFFKWHTVMLALLLHLPWSKRKRTASQKPSQLSLGLVPWRLDHVTLVVVVLGPAQQWARASIHWKQAGSKHRAWS